MKPDRIIPDGGGGRDQKKNAKTRDQQSRGECPRLKWDGDRTQKGTFFKKVSKFGFGTWGADPAFSTLADTGGGRSRGLENI